MNCGKTIFSQLMEHLSHYEFQKCVARHRGERKVKSFSCWDQFLTMAFAQLCGRESLRDIEASLRALSGKLYHMGLRSLPARNTLSNANAVRPWRIWEDLGRTLIAEARRLYAGEPLAVELRQSVYALDATTVDLCLSLFPWAHFRKTKAGVKLHALLDLRGSIPAFVVITEASVHEVNILDQLPVEAGSFYLLDRGYLDFSRLCKIHQAGAFFITRAKSNTATRRLASLAADKAAGVQCDQIVSLRSFYPNKDYPERLRRVRFKDPASGERVVFLTNNFMLDGATIAALYKMRWAVELFFKWIKQHLRIKRFYGTSQNAVKSQIWIAISVYVLVAIVRRRLALEESLYTILQVLSVTLFEKTPISEVFGSATCMIQDEVSSKQLDLFD